MNIRVDGNNFFHTGWIAGHLGLPRTHPSESAIRASDVAAFQDGWDMAAQTAPAGRSFAFQRMKEMGQVVVFWVDDDGNEVEEQG